ncbi:uncharacterized protein RAG0_11606 [Rhynchosporium agropyri]|uniref:Uncharacterized protein n=1 Tax=Rhynchosporium agropyri TaxID=914238 RepID=A0A1E1L508_9HELO|nr:uncharacterized protein RAG0_11606 [Rhynchosporium agropyri]
MSQNDNSYSNPLATNVPHITLVYVEFCSAPREALSVDGGPSKIKWRRSLTANSGSSIIPHRIDCGRLELFKMIQVSRHHVSGVSMQVGIGAVSGRVTGVAPEPGLDWTVFQPGLSGLHF